jgi:hypothetical protein
LKKDYKTLAWYCVLCLSLGHRKREHTQRKKPNNTIQMETMSEAQKKRRDFEKLLEYLGCDKNHKMYLLAAYIDGESAAFKEGMLIGLGEAK